MNFIILGSFCKLVTLPYMYLFLCSLLFTKTYFKWKWEGEDPSVHCIGRVIKEPKVVQCFTNSFHMLNIDIFVL